MTRALPALLVLWAGAAHAHSRSFSYSTWTCEGRHARAAFRLRTANLAELLVGPGLESGSIGPADLVTLRELARARVAERVSVTQQGTTCTPELAPGPARRQGDALAVTGTWVCPLAIETAGLRIEVDLLPELGLVHTHLLRLAAEGDRREAALSRLTPAFAWSPHGGAGPAGGGLAAVATFLQTGVLHIAQGWDHLAFLLVLFLVVWWAATDRRNLVRELLLTATGFTLGHSVTLALAATGLVRARSPTVELLIAVSIGVLALEGFATLDPRSRAVRLGGAACLVALPLAAAAGWLAHSPLVLGGLAAFSLAYLEWTPRSRRPPAQRRAVAQGFGLLHGQGFAEVLLEAELSGPTLALALLSFNVGVELGQAAVLAGLALLLWRQHDSRARPALVLAGSAAAFCLAGWWLGQRAGG